MFKRFLLLLPKSWKFRIKSLLFAPFDLFDHLRGKHKQLTPRRSLLFVGRGDFVRIGKDFLDIFKAEAGLVPSDDVLDVGSGVGRMAIPLIGYLENRYEGFDIVPEGVNWCQKTISSRHPNFQFLLADVHSKTYNPTGKVSANAYVFPYEQHSFSFVFATSVLTHLLPDAVDNYLRQIARVLKPDGRCLLTFFLLNNRSRENLKNGQAQVDFKIDHGMYRVVDRDMPENAVAYDEGFVEDLLDSHGLCCTSVSYGAWSGSSDYLSFQDVVIATFKA